MHMASLELIDVVDWEADDFFATYPEGARDKRALYPPDACLLPFIKKSRRHLFKLSDQRYPEQYWGEIVAYHIGEMIGVPVPPAYPAIDSSRNESAALIEWFYEDDVQSSILGGRFMQSMIEGFDVKKGSQHNFRSIVVLFKYFHQQGFLAESAWIENWAKGLVFDALIGNTDRHQNNWALLFQAVGGKGSVSMAPWFDNGTSLGCDRHEKKVSSWPEAHFMQYLQNGKHHMRWDKSSKERCGLFEMPLLLADFDPSLREPMLSCIERLDLDKLDVILAGCMEVPAYTRLSPWRAQFMRELVALRKDIVAEILA